MLALTKELKKLGYKHSYEDLRDAITQCLYELACDYSDFKDPTLFIQYSELAEYINDYAIKESHSKGDR